MKMDKVIVYGNTPSAYLSAVYIRQLLACDVSLVLPPMATKLSDIAYAETLSPSALALLTALPIDQKQLKKYCHGQDHLATQLINTYSQQAQLRDVLLPHGEIGPRLSGIDFHYYLQAAKEPNYEQYSLACSLLRANKYATPVKDQSSIFSSYATGMNIEVTAFTRLMSILAKQLEVKILPVSNVEAVCINGAVDYLSHEQGRLSADLYIDCSTERSLINAIEVLNQHKKQTIWDSSIIFETPNMLRPMHADTLSIHEHGLLSTHFLDDKICYQFYYSSEFLSREQAFEELSNKLNIKANTSYRIQKHNTTYRTQHWISNVLAVGDANPSPCLIGRGKISDTIGALTRLVQLAPVSKDFELNAKEFNRITKSTEEQLFDFQDAYFSLNDLPKSATYQQLTLNKPSNTLLHRMNLFFSAGKSTSTANDPFEEYQWLNLFIALGMRPHKVHPQLEPPNPTVISRLSQIARLVKKAVSSI